MNANERGSMGSKKRKAAIKPFPFCKNSSLVLGQAHFGEYGGFWSVICLSCLAEGPIKEVRGDARKAWNIRE